MAGFSLLKSSSSNVSVNEALVNFQVSGQNIPVWIYALNRNCQKCPLVQKLKLEEDHHQLVVGTNYPSVIRLRTCGTPERILEQDKDVCRLCEVEYQFHERGTYSLEYGAHHHCTIKVLEDPSNIYLDLLYSILILLTLFSLKYCCARWVCPKINATLSSLNLISEPPGPLPSSFTENYEHRGSTLLENEESDRSNNASSDTASSTSTFSKRQNVRRRKRKNASITNLNNTSVEPMVSPAPAALARFRSIDTFRGVCIAFMIFVNYGGGKYFFFEHSTWNGITFADLVFPWFIWIMGVCAALSVESQKRKALTALHSRWKLKSLKRIIVRSLRLIFLGLMINTSKKSSPVLLSKIRLPGVLQRIGVSYFLVSSIFLFAVERNWIGWSVMVLLSVGHFLFIFLYPVPGCTKGYFGPGGLEMNYQHASNCVGGFTGYVDRLLFTEYHMYPNASTRSVYDSGIFDPEGLVGCIPSAFQAWLGISIGKILAFKNATNFTFSRRQMALCSLLIMSTLLGSGALTNFTLTEGMIPLNKNLWSWSFTLLTAGLAMIFFFLVFLIVDYLKLWDGGPFFEIGMNSILIYCFHVIFANTFPFNFSVSPSSTHLAFLLKTLWGTWLWIMIAKYLYRKDLFFVV